MKTGEDNIYYTLKDYLGSIMVIANASGTKLEEYSYDAWGRRRNKDNWTYSSVSAPTYITRGYTGHEHIEEVGLINMNGRVYDPLVGLFLSPDPMIQSPYDVLNYNRYSYVGNNPLKYTDPSGYYKVSEFIKRHGYRWPSDESPNSDMTEYESFTSGIGPVGTYIDEGTGESSYMFQDEETGQNYIWGYKPWEGDKFVPIEMQIGDNYSIYWSRESGVEGYKIFIDGDDSNYELNAGEYLYGDGEGDNEPRERAKNIDGSIDVTKTLPFRFQMVPNIVNWFLSKGGRYAGYNENTYIYIQSSSSSGVDSLLEIIDSGVIYNSPYDQLKYVGPDTIIFKYLGDE